MPASHPNATAAPPAVNPAEVASRALRESRAEACGGPAGRSDLPSLLIDRYTANPRSGQLERELAKNRPRRRSATDLPLAYRITPYGGGASKLMNPDFDDN